MNLLALTGKIYQEFSGSGFKFTPLSRKREKGETLSLEGRNPDRLPEANHTAYRLLRWQRGKLWVDSSLAEASGIVALMDEQQIESCLDKAPIDAVCIDLDIGEESLERWANVCLRKRKDVFVRVASKLRMEFNHAHLLTWRLKRICDWIVALLLLLLLSPIWVVLSILVKFSSPGPIFFRQWRVGRRGRLFRIFKFRTMSIGSEQQHWMVMGEQAGLHKRTDDPRVTGLGRWMRKSSLDELPQLLNVLRGEMSLVGPRPWALYDALRIKQEDRRRLLALPGITGLWQVAQRSNLLDIDLVTELDFLYLSTWSLGNDLWILARTIPSVMSGRGAC